MPKLQAIYVIFCINSIDFTQFLIGNFSNSLLIDQALIRLILFFILNMSSLMCKRLTVFQKICHLVHSFWDLKYKQENSIEWSFYQNKVQLVISQSSHVNNHQTIMTLIRADFYTFYKTSHFWRVLKFISGTCYTCWLHFMLSVHDRPNRLELDSSIMWWQTFHCCSTLRVESET